MEKNERSHTIVFGSAVILVGMLYTAVSIVALYMFGGNECETVTTILKMIGSQENSDNKTPWESFALRIIFVIVLFCHIPFIFFSGKEAVLIAIDEMDRRSISRALDIKIKIMTKADKED